MSERTFFCDEIQVLSPFEAIRKRPAMYVGELGAPDLATRLLKNALADVIARAEETVNEVVITLGYKPGDGRFSVNSSLSVERHPKRPQRLAELYLTELCMGVSDAGYGLPILVAMSSELHFDTCSAGHEWFQSFENGKPGEFVKSGECDAKRTEVMFQLDPAYVHNLRFDAAELRRWLAETHKLDRFLVDDFQDPA